MAITDKGAMDAVLRSGGVGTLGPILVVHNRYQQRGGEDRVFEAEVALLREHGHDVITYIADNTDLPQGNVALAAGAVWNRKAHRALQQIIRSNRPSVAHFHNTMPLISPAGYYAAKSLGVPVVQTLHNYRVTCANALLFRDGHPCEKCLGKAIGWRGVALKCYRDSMAGSAAVATTSFLHRMLGTWRSAVDAYIALSEFSRGKFVAAGLPADRIVVKPNFVVPPPSFEREPGGYMLYAGRLSAEKGIGVMLRAWDNIGRRTELRIAGDGPLAELVREATGRNSAIRWLGQISREELDRQLASASAVILPSLCYENFPMSLIEASVLGVPAIASDHGAISELIDHGRTGLLFAPGNPAALAACVDRIVADPELVVRMGESARSQCLTKYSAAENYRQLHAIYARVIRDSLPVLELTTPVAHTVG